MFISTRKRLLAALIAIVFTVATAQAQAPQKMSFQSVVRNSSGVLVASHSVGLRLSILQGSISGTAVYVETQTATSNANGLVTLQIGGGTVVTGTFSTIDWSAGPYYIKSELDPTGGTSYLIAGTTQLLSVAYALYANSAGSTISSNGSGAHMAIYTSSGTFTVPHGVISVIVELWGAGGGGGNLGGCGQCGGAQSFSGGGGGYGKQSLTVTSDSTYNITIGTGGIGVVSGCGSGGNGGTTTFSSLYATGGSGGYWCSGCNGNCNNGVTGGISNALINLSGSGLGSSGGSNFGYGYGTGAGLNGNGTSGAAIIYW